jgi:hypothetical protein
MAVDFLLVFLLEEGSQRWHSKKVFEIRQNLHAEEDLRRDDPFVWVHVLQVWV